MKWMDEGAVNPLSTNEALFEAALNEFAAHTFANASLNEILKSAGMNKGSFYYRFHDKLELYLSLLLRIGNEKLATFKQHESQTKPLGFFEEFRKKALIGLQFAKSQPLYYALFQRVSEEKSDTRQTIVTFFGGAVENMMEEMILRAKASGELREDLPVQATAFLISSLMSKIDTIISPDLDDEKTLASVDMLLDILKTGMAKN